MANYELQLLSKVLTAKDPDHAWKEINELMGYQNMFQVYRDEFDALTKFRDKYKKFPTKDTFLKQNPRIEDLPKATDPIRFYVDEVRDSFTYAKMSELNELLVTELRKGNAQDAYRKVSSELAKMQFMAKAGRTINMSDTVDDRIKSYDLRRTEQAVNGIPTGWNSLDLETTGWQDGELSLILGRMGSYKTWVLLAWASYCWTTGKVPVVFSREMPAQQIMRRIDAILTRVRFNDLRKGSLSDKDFKSFGKNIKALYNNKHPFFVVDAAGNSRFDVEFIQRTIAELQVDAAYIDGAYMLEAPGSSIWEKQTSISRGLKQVCIGELVPIVATSQANRGAAGKTAKIGNENAAYSDSWSQDADNIIALMRVWDEHYQRYKDEILVETTKLREGDPVSLQIHVDLDDMAFNEGLDIQSKDEGAGFDDWNPTEQTSLL